MDALSIFLASMLVGKVCDELAAKYPKWKKYIGIFSWSAKLYGKVKGGKL